MKITNDTQNISNFKSFYVHYDTAKNLYKLPNKILADILDVGRKMEKTEYIDLELLSDMKFRIREKTNYYSGIKEPIKVTKPKQNETTIRISGYYNGIDDEAHKCGDPYSISIEYLSYEEALKGYNMIESGKNKIQRIGNIAKEMDSQKISQSLRRDKENKNRTHLATVIMDKYGDIVREFKPESLT